MVDMDRIGQLLRSGCTVVLDALDTFDPTMEIACRALQWWSRELVQVNTYLTTASASGFSLHWDDHDVVIVQIAGEKSWEVRGLSRVAPMYRDAEANIEPSQQTIWAGTLRPGDVMHIPRGYWHQATRADKEASGYSLHLTFGFVKRTGVDWLAWVADRSRERELFRRDLDRWGEHSGREHHEDALSAEVSRLLSDYSVDDYLAVREQDRPPTRQVATGGIFGPPRAVMCVTDFPPRVVPGAGVVEVFACGKKFTFAKIAEAALTMLLSGHPVELAAVSNATGVDVTGLCDLLIKEGVCAELTEELYSGCTGLIPTEPSSNTH
ncbi:cupin domain-containing protein [Actinoalloteichus caeruleus]|uniref:cupin domain-containing protein n=1 Tax=Actinoalloteichus cyanogriseus TaxID=2893586 RepID=UPI00200BE2CA|nr:cupin domain-containing protein [Actinoalloteichus caeruleus]